MKIASYFYAPRVAYNRGRFHQHVYEQLLRAPIPKVQNFSQVVSIFAPMQSASVKALHKMLIKLTPDLQGTHHEIHSEAPD